MGHAVHVAAPVDHLETVAEFFGKAQKTGPHLSLEFHAEILKPLLRRLAREGTLQPIGRVHVDQQGQVRLYADHQRMQIVHHLPQITARQALIHPRAVSKTVADDDLSCLQGGANGPLQMVAAGEDSGKLGEVLEEVSDYYHRLLRDAIKSVTSMIEPLMIVLMGSVVGFIAMAIILPIFKMSSLVTN